MQSRKKFTPDVISEIGRWVDQGLSAIEIAQKVGCTLGSLRVRCSQLGINLRNRQAGARGSGGARGANGTRNPSWERESRAGAEEPNSKQRLRLVVSIPRATMDHLRIRATSKGISGPRFAAMLLEKIAQDDLYEAVIDEN